jgi:hypothetical protein
MARALQMRLGIGYKVGAATAVDPDTPVVKAPRLTLDAGGTATLIGELNPAASVCRAVVSPAIVR